MNYDINTIAELVNTASKEILNAINGAKSPTSIKHLVTMCLGNCHFSVRDKFYVYSPCMESDYIIVKVEYYFAGREKPIGVCYKTYNNGNAKAVIVEPAIVVNKKLDFCVDGFIHCNCIRNNAILYVDWFSPTGTNEDTVNELDDIMYNSIGKTEYEEFASMSFEGFYSKLTDEERKNMKVVDINLLNLSNEVSVERIYLNRLLCNGAEEKKYSIIVWGDSWFRRKKSNSQCVVVLDSLYDIGSQIGISVVSTKDYFEKPRIVINTEMAMKSINDYYAFSNDEKGRELAISQFHEDYGIVKD